MNQNRTLSTFAMALIAMLFSANLMAQKTKTTDADLIGVWVMESMRFEGEKENMIGENYNQVKVYRANKRIASVDLYDYLMNGKVDTDIRLDDNDVVVVDPISSLVCVDGRVRRPMFYEAADGEKLDQLLKYAGGFASETYYSGFYYATKTLKQIVGDKKAFPALFLDKLDCNGLFGKLFAIFIISGNA